MRLSADRSVLRPMAWQIASLVSKSPVDAASMIAGSRLLLLASTKAPHWSAAAGQATRIARTGTIRRSGALDIHPLPVILIGAAEAAHHFPPSYLVEAGREAQIHGKKRSTGT